MKEKSTILIVDDSELNRTVLADILGDEYNFIEAENGARAIELLRTHTDIDLILLDIEMDRLNGMELAKHLRSNGDMLPIVFITGYSDYIAEGYDVEALHYLLKPVAKEKLFAVLDKYVEKRSVKADELIIETTNGATHISADRITYIEAFGRKTAVHLSDDRIIDCMVSISRFFAMRLNGFVSPHRSYIVNLRFMRSIGKTEIALDNGTIIPLSRRLYKDVNEKFIQFYTKG